MSHRTQTAGIEVSASQTANSVALATGKADFLNDWSLRIEDGLGETQPATWRRLGLSAAIAGIVFAMLNTIGYYLVAQSPQGNATDAQIVAYYADGRTLSLTLAGMFIVPYAGMAFLYFMVMLRAMARARPAFVSAGSSAMCSLGPACSFWR